MHKKFVPLTLDILEEGELLTDLNETLSDLQASLLGYVEKHGEDAAKAKATLTLKITISVESIEDERFAVMTGITASQPRRPSRASMAIASVDDRGVPSLFARASGSSDEDPRQHKLCTDDGRAIDIESGEVSA